MKDIIISKTKEGTLLTTKVVDMCCIDMLTSHHEKELSLKWKLITTEDLPGDFSIFYSAFRLKDGFDNETSNIKDYIYVDYSRAKEIWLDYYREARASIMSSVDVDFMRAVESENAELRIKIAAEKQALRSVTETELPDDLEGIKNIWPEILGPNPFKN